jgi:hypothetical protein
LFSIQNGKSFRDRTKRRTTKLKEKNKPPAFALIVSSTLKIRHAASVAASKLHKELETKCE